MECTQRLECTQNLYAAETEEARSPEQIGFLGICGVKYPVMQGINKIGRDETMCNIVLDSKKKESSVSRTHAVINVLNKKEYMLMDLDSANKTKLNNKPLQPYISYPLKSGDTVQIGQQLGLFRLLEEETDLPMTQVIDIPDTPMANKHTSRACAGVTTVPESPDVSDRDDSFIMPSQPKPKSYKSPSSKFIKQSGKTTVIQPIGSNQIDNVYWSSSKKSLSLDDSDTDEDTMVTAHMSHQNDDIHEMETQPPFPDKMAEDGDSIYTAATQLPNVSRESIYSADTQYPNDRDSIHSAATQFPGGHSSPSIHSLDTQMPEHLPIVQTISDQKEMQFDLYSANKENISIHNAETQVNSPILGKVVEAEEDIFGAATQYPKNKPNTSENNNIDNSVKKIETSKINVKENELIEEKTSNNIQLKGTTSTESDKKVSKDKLNSTSDEEILFDELDGHSFDDEFFSQALIPSEGLELKDEVPEIPLSQSNLKVTVDTVVELETFKECDDITLLPTQKISSLPNNDDDLTDCEDDHSENGSNKNKDVNLPTNKHDSPDMLADEIPTQVLEKIVEKPNKSKDIVCNVNEVPFDEMATQVLEEEEILLQVANTNKPTDEDVVILDDDFREMATQIIEIPEQENINIEDIPTQVLEKDPEKTNVEDLPTQVLEKVSEKIKDDPEQYSEELISPFKIPHTPSKNKRDSLKKISPIISNVKKPPKSKTIPPIPPTIVVSDDENYYEATQDILNDLCSQQASPEIVKFTKTADNKLNKSPSKTVKPQSKADAKSSCDFIEPEVAPLRKSGSGPSDVDVTPKKVRPFKLMRTELPDSQEIKKTVSLTTKTSAATESSSESEVEQNSEEMTPIVFRKKQRKKKSPTDAKMDLIKKFEASSKASPARVITRVRKPTAKLLESDILKPKYLTEQDDVDKDIITENITRWKSKNDKKITSKSNKAKPEDKACRPAGNSKNDDIKAEMKKRISSKNYEDLSEDIINVKKTKLEEKIKPAVKSQETSNKSNEKPSIEIDNEKETSGIGRGTKRTRSCRSNTSNKTTEEKQSLSPEGDAIARNERGRCKQPKTSKDTDTTLKELQSTSQRKADGIGKQKNKGDTSTKDTDTTIKAITSHRKADGKQNNKGDTSTITMEIKEDKQGGKQNIKAKAKGRPKKSVKDSTDSDASVRRSNRQKTISKNDTIDQYLVDMGTPALKSNQVEDLEVHELSKVYSVSSGSGEDTPCLKRSATSYFDAPSPKRTRSQSRGVRATPARLLRTQHVLFTAFNNDEVRKKLEKLGAVIVTEVKSCTVVLTSAIKRTFKLLCAVGLGVPIVGPEWVQACSNTNTIVDPWLYIIKDEASEQRFQFSLQRTLVSKRGFLKGYHVSSTPKVMPSAPEMKLIVECSGGTWRACGPKWVCVSCLADRELWPELAAKGATIVSNEFILSGVLRQIADVNNNKLY